MAGVASTQPRCPWQAVRELCAELRPDAVALVDAYEFHDNVLNSALGRHDGRVYESLLASAQASPLNARDPYTGYEAAREKVVDKDFIAEHAKMVRQAPLASSRL